MTERNDEKEGEGMRGRERERERESIPRAVYGR